MRKHSVPLVQVLNNFLFSTYFHFTRMYSIYALQKHFYSTIVTSKEAIDGPLSTKIVQ